MLGLAARMAAKMAAKKIGKQAAKEADEIPRYTQSKSYKALEKAQKNSGPEAVLRDVEKGGAVALGSALAGAAGKSSLEDKETPQPKEESSEKEYRRGGKVSSASKRADGCCIKGKTKGKMV